MCQTSKNVELVHAFYFVGDVANEFISSKVFKRYYSRENAILLLGGLVFLIYVDRRMVVAEHGMLDMFDGSPESQKEFCKMMDLQYVPPSARTARLVNLPKRADLGAEINDAIRAIESESYELQGVLPQNYNHVENYVLIDALRQLQRIPDDGGSEIFCEIIEYMLTHIDPRAGKFEKEKLHKLKQCINPPDYR